VRLCSFINMSQYVSTSKESALVACVTQEIYPELSARHVARGTWHVCVCVCACRCMCVRNNVYSTSGTREIETNDKNWSCVCVCVCLCSVWCYTRHAHPNFSNASLPKRKVSTRKCGCVNLLCTHLCVTRPCSEAETGNWLYSQSRDETHTHTSVCV